jgi:hypothetical protein
MARKTLLECAFLIPIRRDRNRSDGKLHKRGAWKWLEDGLLAFGGGTRDTDLKEGWYPDPDTGERVWDRSRRYVIALPRQQVDELRGVLREACRVFRQKCIYLSVAGHVEFVEGPSDAR